MKKNQLSNKELKFVNELAIQKSKDPAKAVLATDTTIITVESAEQLSKKHLSQPAVRYMLDQILDDTYLIEKHKELLDQKQTIVTWDSKNQQLITEITNVPDPVTALKALDMAYKLKGMYAPEQRENINVNLDARAKDNPRIVEITEEYEEKLKEMFAKGKPTNTNDNKSTTNPTILEGDSN